MSMMTYKIGGSSLLECVFLFVTCIIVINLRHTMVLSMSIAEPPDSHDYCLHESFNASCRPGTVILMRSATYGRMRIGRCITNDVNLGCSKDVMAYLDSLCSAKEWCEVTVRNFVEIHPCQRDFMSYLEASYQCIEVSTVSSVACPRDGKIRLTSSLGYVVHGATARVPPVHPSSAAAPLSGNGNLNSGSIGSETCPWHFVARSGQTLQLKIIVLNDEDLKPANHEEVVLCTSIFVIIDIVSGITEVAVCSGRARERHLYTSTGSEVTLQISRDQMSPDRGGHIVGEYPMEFPRFILRYEAIGCPDLVVPPNAWTKRSNDNVMIHCNDTLETWYLTCQGNRWIGDNGNCSQRVPLMKDAETGYHGSFPTHGIILAVLLGVALGIFIGMVLLLSVHCVRRRTVRSKGTSMLMTSRGGKEDEGLMTSSTMAATECGTAGIRRGASGVGFRINDPNYPALIMNIDKVYDLETTTHYGYGYGRVRGTGRASRVRTGGGSSDVEGSGVGEGEIGEYERRCLFDTSTSQRQMSNSFHDGGGSVGGGGNLVIVGDYTRCVPNTGVAAQCTLPRHYRCCEPIIARTDCEACLDAAAAAAAATTAVAEAAEKQRRLIESVDLIATPQTNSNDGRLFQNSSDAVTACGSKMISPDGLIYPPGLRTPESFPPASMVMQHQPQQQLGLHGKQQGRGSAGHLCFGNTRGVMTVTSDDRAS